MKRAHRPPISQIGRLPTDPHGMTIEPRVILHIPTLSHVNSVTVLLPMTWYLSRLNRSNSGGLLMISQKLLHYRYRAQ